MNKNIKIVVSVVAAIAIAAGSFAAGTFVKKPAKNKNPASQSTKTAVSDKTDEEENDIFDSYKNVLIDNDLCSYYLLDMDEDGTPELILDAEKTDSEGSSSQVLALYTYTEDKGAFKFGEISGCGDEASLYAIEREKDLFVYDLSFDDNDEYHQTIRQYSKKGNELSDSVLLDKTYKSWCLEMEENCFTRDFKILKASDDYAVHYFEVLSDSIQNGVEIGLDDTQFGIYNAKDFDYKRKNNGKYLSVTREDLFNLGTGAQNRNSFINNILGYFHCDCPVNYNRKNGSTEDLIRRIIGEGAYGETYKYYFGDFKSVKYSEKHDPLNMFSEVSNSDFGPTGIYYIIPAENVRWIMKNIFNRSDWIDSYKVDEDDFKCYLSGGNFYAEAIDFDGGDYTRYRIETINDNEDGTYNVFCVDNQELYDSFEMTVALKNIDGKRRWTLVSLER